MIPNHLERSLAMENEIEKGSEGTPEDIISQLAMLEDEFDTDLMACGCRTRPPVIR